MSWEQLRSILADARVEVEARETEPPRACPHDGEPLRSAPSGDLYCPWGDFRWPRDEVVAIR